MKSITEVAEITGIIPQRINDYEKAGLLEKPTARNKYHYRQYGDKEILRLWQIRFYKELGYTIPQMKKVFTDPAYQPELALGEQIRLLEEKKKKIEALLLQAEAMRQTGLDLAFAYEAIPGVNQLSYDEAAKFAFSLWSKALLDGVEEAKAEAGEDDSDNDFYEDLEEILALLEDDSDPADPVIQASLRALKQRYEAPIAGLCGLIEVREFKEAFRKAYRAEAYERFKEAVKIAAEAESADMLAQGQLSINRLRKLQPASPEQPEVQQEVAWFLRTLSYGKGIPEDPENPKDYEIEAIETLIQQYADRNGAACAVEYRAQLARIAKAGKAGPEAKAKAKARVDRQHAMIMKTLVPALRVYLKNVKEKAERRNAGRQDRKE